MTPSSVGSVAAKTVDLDASNALFTPSSLKNILKNGIIIFMGSGNPLTYNDCVIDVDGLPGKTMFTQTPSDYSLFDKAIDMASRILFECVYVINPLNAFSA